MLHFCFYLLLAGSDLYFERIRIRQADTNNSICIRVIIVFVDLDVQVVLQVEIIKLVKALIISMNNFLVPCVQGVVTHFIYLVYII